MKLPDFSYEFDLWKKGILIIAGIDEVGRGSFAGPVVAGAVTFAPMANVNNQKILINDSKKLTFVQRKRANEWIKENCLTWGIGKASVSVINKVGIGKATNIAFRQAVKNANQRLGHSIKHLLIDAYYLPYIKGIRKSYQTPIVKGDQISLSIASASIIAKVYRDQLMVNFSKQAKFKRYGWDENKGYGTKAHQAAILQFGPVLLHRKAFIQTLNKNRT